MDRKDDFEILLIVLTRNRLIFFSDVIKIFNYIMQCFNKIKNSWCGYVIHKYVLTFVFITFHDLYGCTKHFNYSKCLK